MSFGKEQKHLRLLVGLAIGIVIGVLDFLIVTLTLVNWLNIAKWDFVPNIANGIVSASSILMAVAFFSLNYFNGTIKSEPSKKAFHSLAMHNVLGLFGLLIGEVWFGYFAISINLLPVALCVFLSVFFLQCGVIFNMWIDGEKYCFS